MCIVTRTVKDEAELIRFARSPDGMAVPDLARKLPGRGLWVSLDRKVLDQAIAWYGTCDRRFGGSSSFPSVSDYSLKAS